MLNIKEIAEESGAVAYSPAPLRAVRGYSFTFEQLQNFAETLIAELAKGNEPVAWVGSRLVTCDPELVKREEAKGFIFFPLFRTPPSASQIEHETAEKCAEWVRSGLHDDDPYIIARGLEDGAWKEFK